MRAMMEAVLGSGILRARKGQRMGRLNLRTEKHIFIQASTRSGKGVTLIIPHLLRYPGSVFGLDPKGENCRATWRQRSQLNQKVHALDPFGLTGKRQSRFNPLATFTPETMEEKSKALAMALVLGEGGKRDFWTMSAQQLAALVMLYVYSSPDIPPDKKDLVTARRLLLSGLPVMLDACLKSAAGNNLLADLGQSFLVMPERMFGDVVATAQRETDVLDNPFLQASLAASGPGEEVHFADWHTGTMTVYLCLSGPKFPVFNRWLRLVLTSALDEMTDRLNPPPLPVCFMLDELASLGHLDVVQNSVGLAAGYGVQLVTVWQDIPQMRDCYQGRWASFIGNAGVKAIFNLDEHDTAEYWSKTLGSRLVETHSQQQDIYGLVQGQTAGESVRPLLSPEDIMFYFATNSPRSEGEYPRMLVLAEGSRPVIAKRVPYYEDPALAGLWDDPRAHPENGSSH